MKTVRSTTLNLESARDFRGTPPARARDRRHPPSAARRGLVRSNLELLTIIEFTHLFHRLNVFMRLSGIQSHAFNVDNLLILL